jgi:transposase
MSDRERGTDGAGRRAKWFLTPFTQVRDLLQLVRQEVTLAEAADSWKVDRSTIMRIRTVAKEGALEALANSRPGLKAGSTIGSWSRPGPTPLAWARRSRRWPSS